jgi:DNA-binding transcriptional LysR family regulator
MLRRIDAVEAKLQVRLFERLRNGYAVTEAGETLCRAAEQCEPLVAEAERRVVGGDMRLTGTLRVNTVSYVAHHLLPPVLAKFCHAHPGIEVELRTEVDLIDMSRRDADIALRVAVNVPDHLVGRKLGAIRTRVYASKHASFFRKRRPAGLLPLNTILHDFPWISSERDLMTRPSQRWMEANVPPSSVAVRVDHFPSALAMLRTGIGVALLPDIVATNEPNLIPLSAPIAELEFPLWILTHPDLRNSARVRAFLKTVGDELIRLLPSR